MPLIFTLFYAQQICNDESLKSDFYLLFRILYYQLYISFLQIIVTMDNFLFQVPWSLPSCAFDMVILMVSLTLTAQQPHFFLILLPLF